VGRIKARVENLEAVQLCQISHKYIKSNLIFLVTKPPLTSEATHCTNTLFFKLVSSITGWSAAPAIELRRLDVGYAEAPSGL
jgi:hypothetical protein